MIALSVSALGVAGAVVIIAVDTAISYVAHRLASIPVING